MNTFSAFKEWSDQNDSHIEILVPTGKTTVVNKFRPSASEEKIKELSNYFSTPLPPDYISFLRLCNGASLFEDPEYGGENFLYSAQDVMHYNEASNSKIVVANILDDRILIDLDRWRSHDEQYLLLCESLYSVEHTGSFYSNFETWLQRFVISQGSKFWYWRTDRI
ncbi:SMI1/KNR4 family protein [Paenibacillus marchantiae]|uniref:SMI1/KNR4 family protein n=1 Tax=Paenibacillus marchantiae TaxID=3026433 RepID=UPI00237C05ED|nr:SMI1/KNR4 family protein [Paenibacillus marchantiae]WDQ30458.1 SMI1/KNR4 family protein [Paenibacillus marchantiae]